MGLRIGVAEVDITPTWPVELGGFVARVQPSVGVHDAIYARALVGEADSGQRLIWLHADCIGFHSRYVERIRRRMSRQLGIPPENVLLSATHTHSAPATMDLILTGHTDPRYMSWLEERATEAVEAAFERVCRCEVLSGRAECRLGAERRGDLEAPVDASITVVAFITPEGEYRAIIGNYAVHNVALGHENRYVSGDIHGHAARWVSENVSGSPVCLMLSGACGNINPPSQGTDFERPAAWGEELGTAVCRALKSAQLDKSDMDLTRLFVELEVEALEGQRLQERAERLREQMGDGSTYASDRARQAVGIWEQHMRARRRFDPIPMEVQVVRFGKTCFACFGAEVFSHMASALPDVCPVGYANGIVGYLAPSEVYDQGGYEVDTAHVFYDTPRILPGGFERAVDSVQRALHL